MSRLNVDEALERVRKCQALKERELKQLFRKVSGILLDEPNVLHLRAPLTICGDIHGQFHDVLELLRKGGDCGSETRYLFMGDIVDRGHHSLETLTLLLLMKAKWSEDMFLIRGNHESRQITRVYGFFEEVMRKYGSASCWRLCNDAVFDALPIAAAINGSILCIHGGLSPDLSCVAHLSLIDRRQEVPGQGVFADLLWSDPSSEIDGWAVSPRGAGFLFGEQVAREFSQLNGLSQVCRAHQLVYTGFKFDFEPAKSVCTVWSAPNYVYRCGNVAAILQFDSKLNQEVVTFEDTEGSRRETAKRKRPLPYFL